MRVGIGGPVGTGKSSLIAELCGLLAPVLRVAVVTNDIYTTEDARFLRARGVLEPERIVAVQTGCCPHTAIFPTSPRVKNSTPSATLLQKCARSSANP